MTGFKMRTIKTIFLSLFTLVVVNSVSAQISIAPTQVFIHDKQGAGEIFLTNTSDTPQEISFDMRFGYPASTEEGAIMMVYDDSLKQKQHGLDGRVRLFPSLVVIPPNRSQTVRIQILSMRDKPEGVYWTRLLVSSSPITPEVDGRVSEGISTDIDYVLEQNIPLFYRHGENSTGIRVMEVETAYDDATQELTATPKIGRIGNSPYLGTMYATLYDQADRQIEQKEIPAYFYFEDWRRLTFAQVDKSKGPFRLDLEFKTHRRTISSSKIVQAEEQRHSVRILP